MDKHQRHSSSLCKRKRNKIPLNLVSTKKGRKKRRLKITKEVVDVPLSNNVVTPDSAWLNHDESESYQDNINDAVVTSVSAHTKRKQKLSEKWNALRSGAYRVMIQAHGFYPDQNCFTCNSDSANVRCEQCGPALYMCSTCCINIHSRSHYHHFPEIWQDNCFVLFKLPTPTVQISDHDCTSKFFRLITCFHIEGIPYHLNVQFCKCVPDSLRLIKLGYWPATPTRPVLAFTHSFMEWMEALLLECQVSVQDFSSAVEMIIKEKFMKMPCSIYPVLIDAFEEFRNLKEDIRHLKGIVDKDLFKCPACPKEQGKITLSIDANFGLCRKRAAGNSVHEPLSGTTMFFNQDDVDRYVADYGSTSLATSSDCSEFLAGHALRSRSRFAALRETAIMGVVCRHEFPLCFINLFHGERISYCMYILEQLKVMFPNHDVQVMYDIACLLIKHLKSKKRDDLLTKFSFAVPVFHAYGHTAECQISMNPRNMLGYGLSDGEVVERLWSYLRRFSAMTKEMRPAHRVDVLTHALLYYGRCAAEHIGLLLCKRMDNAVKTLSQAKKDLQIILRESPEPVTELNIAAWACEARVRLSNEPTIPTEHPPPTWQETYVTHFDTLQTIRNALQQPVGDSASVQALTCNLIKTEMLLQKTEESHEIVSRWTPNFQEYVATKDIMKSNLRKKLKSKIRCFARERWFLLRLKSKYADGQKIAIRLSRRITVVSKSLKESLALYNSGIDSSCHLTWSEAISLSSQIYKDCLFDESPVPSVVKYQAVQLHHQISRSEEEIARIKTEIHTEAYEQSEDPLSLYDLGKLCLLKKAMKKCMYQLQSLQCFLQYTELEQLQDTLISLSGHLQHEEQYVPDQVPVGDDAEQDIHSIENVSFDDDTESDLDQRFAGSNRGINMDESSVVNAMSNSNNSSVSTNRSPDTQDYDSVSNVGLDLGLDIGTNLNESSGSSAATLLNKGAEIADTEDELFVIGQSSNAADNVQSAANNQKDGLHNDTITEQDLFGQNSLFLHPEETFASSNVIKQFSTAALNPVTDTDSHELVTESSSEESDEEFEMVVQDWRRNRFLRETYLDSIRNVDDDLSKLLTDLEQSAKVKITEREKGCTIKPISYLDIPREILRESIKQVELAEKRAEKRERLQKLPVFQIK